MCAGEAIDAGVPVAVCSTSNERAVSTIVSVLLGEDVAKKMRVFAGTHMRQLSDVILWRSCEVGST